MTEVEHKWSDIQHPQKWQLLMEAGPEGLAAMAFSALEGDPMHFSEWELPTSPHCDDLKAFENIVYDHTELLADYGKVTLLYYTLRMVPIPNCYSDEDAEILFRSVYPSSGRSGNVIVSRVPELGTAISFEIPADTESFFRRTFPCITIDHPVAPLCRYFRAKHPVRPRGKTLVNLRDKRIDILTLGDHAPLALSSHLIAGPMDAVYYILASRQNLSLRDTDEIMIAGDRMIRAAITPILRRYVRYVMPALFPEVMFRAGRASLSAPFELIVSPLLTPINSTSAQRSSSVSTIKNAAHENHQR